MPKLKSLMPLLILLIWLTGCIADNKTKMAPTIIDHKPEISMPAPEIAVEKVDTDKIVEDTAARVRADMSSNSNQLSGHIVAQLQKMEVALKGLINLEAKIDNKMQADIDTKLTNTMTAMASLENTINAKFEANVNVTNKMEAKLDNTMKALSDINTKVGHMSGQADATASGQVGLSNKLTKMQTTLQTEMRAGRDVNMWPMSAVITVIGVILIMGLLVYGVTVYIGKRAYENASERQKNYARLLMVAMGEMEPDRAKELMSKTERGAL